MHILLPIITINKSITQIYRSHNAVAAIVQVSDAALAKVYKVIQIIL